MVPGGIQHMIFLFACVSVIIAQQQTMSGCKINRIGTIRGALSTVRWVFSGGIKESGTEFCSQLHFPDLIS